MNKRAGCAREVRSYHVVGSSLTSIIGVLERRPANRVKLGRDIVKFPLKKKDFENVFTRLNCRGKSMERVN